MYYILELTPPRRDVSQVGWLGKMTPGRPQGDPINRRGLGMIRGRCHNPVCLPRKPLGRPTLLRGILLLEAEHRVNSSRMIGNNTTSTILVETSFICLWRTPAFLRLLRMKISLQSRVARRLPCLQINPFQLKSVRGVD